MIVDNSGNIFENRRKNKKSDRRVKNVKLSDGMKDRRDPRNDRRKESQG